MQIVIELSDELFNAIKHVENGSFAAREIIERVKNGIILTSGELAQRLMDERIHGELNEDIQYIKDVIEDVKCKLSVEIIDHRPCYCGAELREVWRNADTN